MNVGLDPEALFAIYADWIAFLREKRATFEGQLAKVRGKDVPIKDGSVKAVADQSSSSNGKTSETWLGTTDTLLPDPHLITSSKKEKKGKTVIPASVFAGTVSPDDPLPEPEIKPPLDEKTDEIPEWLWNPGASSNEEDEDLLPSVEADEDDQMDDWM